MTYGHDGITIKQVKRLIWSLLGGKFHPDGRHVPSAWIKTRIHMAKIQVGWDFTAIEGTAFKYNELLQYIRKQADKRIPSAADYIPVTRKYTHWNYPGWSLEKLQQAIAQDLKPMCVKGYTPPVETIETETIIATTQYTKSSMKERYCKAHYDWAVLNTPNVVKDGYYLAPDYPDVKTSNGITNLVTNYLKWCGHFANRTNNQGQARKKEVEKFNIFSGKLEKITVGMTYTKSHSIKGMQDIDCNLKHPKHPYGIPWKIEIKAGRDRVSKDQDKFAVRVKNTGAVHSVITSDESFFAQVDQLLKE